MDFSSAWILTIARLSIAGASVLFGWWGYKLLVQGLTRLEGEIQFKVGKFQAKALKVTAGTCFAFCGAVILISSIVFPPAVRSRDGITVTASKEPDPSVIELTSQFESLRSQVAAIAAASNPEKLDIVGVISSENKYSAVARDPLGKAYVLRPGDPVGKSKIASVKAGEIVLVDDNGKKTSVAVATPQEGPKWDLTGEGLAGAPDSGPFRPANQESPWLQKKKRSWFPWFQD